MKVISGGQTGCDQAGIFAGRRLGLQTGGMAPKGWRTEAGPAPWLADYGLVESFSSGYQWRTRQNVLAADATLIIGDVSSPGSRMTLDAAAAGRLPRLTFRAIGPDFAQFGKEKSRSTLLTWLRSVNPRVINIAGNRESVNPGIQAACEEFLVEILGIHLGLSSY